MLITKAIITKKDACPDQVKIFAKIFPGGTTITEASLKKAMAAKLDLEWAIKNLLPAPAWEAYRKATATAEEAYRKATATAQIAILIKYSKEA